MSSNIEFKRRVYKVEEIPDYGEINYLALILFGESNVRDAYTNAISKDWKLYSYGWEYSLIQTVCQWAGDTEGGMLKLSGRWTKPESYLRLWREAIRKAGTWEDFVKDFYTREGWIEYPKGKRARGYGKRITERIRKEKKLRRKIIKDPFGHYRTTWRIELKTPEDLKKWLELKGVVDYTRQAYSYLHLRSNHI